MVERSSGIQPQRDPRISKILQDSWNHYKKTMIDKDGRPLCEKDDGDIDDDKNINERQTFSEGVSYVLLRAVQMNDAEAFTKTWNWTKKNMQRKNIDKIYYWNKGEWIDPPNKDNLLSWRYIPSLKNKQGGVIKYDWRPNEVWRGCLEAASDADVDTAAALALAGKKWKNSNYIDDAKAMLKDIWDEDVKKVGDHYYLFGGDQFVNMGEINPSYVRPAYFKALFREIDPAHPWQELIISSYKIVVESGDVTLNGVPGKVNLPPNWLVVTSDEKFVGSGIFSTQAGHLFGWDSFRTLFAVAQDYAWNGTQEAKKYLTDKSCSTKDFGPYCFLKKEIDTKGRILAGYNRDGSVVIPDVIQTKDLNTEQYCMYGAYLPFFYYAGDAKAAKQIMQKLQGFYNEAGYWGVEPDNYFGQNWAWFGLALVNGEGIPSEYVDSKGVKLELPAEVVPVPDKPEEKKAVEQQKKIEKTEAIKGKIFYTVPAKYWLNFNLGEKVSYDKNKMILNGEGNNMGVIHPIEGNVKGADRLVFKIKGAHEGIIWRRFKVAIKSKGQEIVRAEEKKEGYAGNTVIRFYKDDGTEVAGISPDSLVTAVIDLKDFDLSAADEVLIMLVGNGEFKNIEVGPFEFIK